MNTAAQIEVGRRVSFVAGYGNIDGEGLIAAVHGTPNPAPSQTLANGIGRIIRNNDCTFDVILFDGRRLPGNHQCSVDRPGIGIKLLERVHGPRMIEVAKRNAAKYESDRTIAQANARQAFEAAEASRQISDPPVFHWNGIKDAKGEKLQKCHYSGGSVNGQPEGTITIYGKHYAGFSSKVRACFAVQNDSDLMTDYFEGDRIRVIPAHPLYAKVQAAMAKQDAHYAKRRVA